MTDSAHLDEVAEAICEAEGHFWLNQFPDTQDTYRRMAQAALDALQLNEETTTYRGVVTSTSPILRRWVSPWVRVDGGDA